MIKEATVKLTKRENLTYDEAAAVMNEIMSGATSQVQTAAYLAALSTKGETVDEITASAAAMRAHAAQVHHSYADLLEIVGTGGDGAHTFNISTTASLVIAAGGVKVAKHGNRAASSKCGAADCLEALGVKIQQTPESCLKMLEEVGICFLFAQSFHASMRYVGPVRKELGIRTIFNILGPLTNPASANIQLLGVYSPDLAEPMAHVLAQLGVKRGMSVYGGGLDEISPCGPTLVCEFEGDKFKTYEITPHELGLEKGNPSELVGGTPEENAAITRKILSGEERGTKRTAVLLNAGASLYLAGKSHTIKDGAALAARLIDSGKAEAKLNELIEASNRLG